MRTHHALAALALLSATYAAEACGGDVETSPSATGAGGAGGTQNAGGAGGIPDLCTAPEGVDARVTADNFDFVSGPCTVTDIAAGPMPTYTLACSDGVTSETITLVIEADPPIDVAIALDQEVVLDVARQNVEGPEEWGSVRATDGALLLGWVSAGSLAYFSGAPWYAPLAIAPMDCGETNNRMAWDVTFDGDTARVADGQRRTVGPNDEYVVQALGLHHPEGMVATTPTNTHLAVIARQP